MKSLNLCQSSPPLKNFLDKNDLKEGRTVGWQAEQKK